MRFFRINARSSAIGRGGAPIPFTDAKTVSRVCPMARSTGRANVNAPTQVVSSTMPHDTDPDDLRFSTDALLDAAHDVRTDADDFDLVSRDRFESGAPIGRGGHGEVRLLRDHRMGRWVAVKTLVASGERARRRFLRELRIQGQLEHPAIVPVHDMGIDDQGRPYFTMKVVRGDTLDAIRDGLLRGDPSFVERYPRRRLLNAFVQICFAIDYAHSRGVVHRDLKPENVMLGGFGEVYVLDWGLARVLRDQAPAGEIAVDFSSLTRPGDTMGTTAYAPLEQLRGDEDLDHRADIYALGLVLFEVLTHRRFFEGKTAHEIMFAVMNGATASPREILPEIPIDLDRICARATQQERNARYPSARELAYAVESFLDR